jgi:hypothetical protein
MLIHLPIVILATLHPIAVADAPPKYDIARECRSEGGPADAQQKCAADEAQARDQLLKEWPQFSASARVQCDGESNMDGTASYVEFLTCLEMERDVAAERQAAARSSK